VVTLAERKPIAQHLIFRFKLSERVACRLAGLSRTMFRYRPKSRADDVIRARLRALATQYPAYGYLLLHSLLKAEGMIINKKHTYRLYTEEGLQVRTNGKFRNECLNLHWFRTLDEAKYEIDLWRDHYNNVRPHSSLNYMPPAEYAKQAA
jgi:hypothetical protein